MGERLGPSVRLSTIAWSCLFILAGVAVIAGWLPGNPGGLRSAIGGVLMTLGALGLVIPLVTWSVLRTTRPEDYEGSCPVGRVCPECEAFTFYPRADCKNCGLDLAPTPVLGRRESEPL